MHSDSAQHNEHVDVEAIMASIRSGIAPGDEETRSPAESSPGSRSFDEEVYRGLKQAVFIGEGSYPDYPIGYRTPLVGPIWAAMRLRIHREIKIYADAVISQQGPFNVHIARLLTRIVETVDNLNLKKLAETHLHQQVELVELRDRVTLLETRIRQLEATQHGDVTTR